MGRWVGAMRPLLLPVLLLAACAPVPTLTERLGGFVGLPEAELVARLGVPDRQAEVQGRRFVTYAVWCAVFVLFRAPSLSAAGQLLSRTLRFSEYSYEAFYARMLLILRSLLASSDRFLKVFVLLLALTALLVLAGEFLCIYRRRAAVPASGSGNVLGQLSVPVRWCCILFFTAMLLCFGCFGSSSFIYFQF